MSQPRGRSESGRQNPQFDGMGRVTGRAPRPYVMVDRELIGMLDPDELALYVVLLSFLRSPERMADRTCWPSQDELAGVYGRGVRVVQRVMDRLVTRGLVTSTRRGKTESNLYTLTAQVPTTRSNDDAGKHGDSACDTSDTTHHPGDSACDTSDTTPHDASDTTPRDTSDPTYEVEEVEVEELKEQNSLSLAAAPIAPDTAPATERELDGISPKTLALVRAARDDDGKPVVSDEETAAFVRWVTDTRKIDLPAWWRTVADNGDLPDLAARWRQRPPERAEPAMRTCTSHWLPMPCADCEAAKERGEAPTEEPATDATAAPAASALCATCGSPADGPRIRGWRCSTCRTSNAEELPRPGVGPDTAAQARARGTAAREALRTGASAAKYAAGTRAARQGAAPRPLSTTPAPPTPAEAERAAQRQAYLEKREAALAELRARQATQTTAAHLPTVPDAERSTS